jgi:hypothetical protein
MPLFFSTVFILFYASIPELNLNNGCLVLAELKLFSVRYCIFGQLFIEKVEK